MNRNLKKNIKKVGGLTLALALVSISGANLTYAQNDIVSDHTNNIALFASQGLENAKKELQSLIEYMTELKLGAKYKKASNKDEFDKYFLELGTLERDNQVTEQDIVEKIGEFGTIEASLDGVSDIEKEIKKEAEIKASYKYRNASPDKRSDYNSNLQNAKSLVNRSNGTVIEEEEEVIQALDKLRSASEQLDGREDNVDSSNPDQGQPDNGQNGRQDQRQPDNGQNGRQDQVQPDNGQNGRQDQVQPDNGQNGRQEQAQQGNLGRVYDSYSNTAIPGTRSGNILYKVDKFKTNSISNGFLVSAGAWNIQNGKWRYSSNINLKNKWAKVDNPYASKNQEKASWFKFDKDGNMLSGWLKDDDAKWYYLNDKSDGSLGAMLTSWQWIKGKDGKQRCYFFNPISNGSMGQLLTNTTTPDGYIVNENGEWTVSGVVQIR